MWWRPAPLVQRRPATARSPTSPATISRLRRPPRLRAVREGKTTLTLSGAKARTTAEIAALVGQTGRQADPGDLQVSVEDLVKGIVAAGLPEPVARIIASFDANTEAGRAGEVTGDFKALTGKDQLPLEQWLAANKTALNGRGGGLSEKAVGGRR